MHLKHYVLLEHMLLHRHDVLALFLRESMNRAALEQSTIFRKLKNRSKNVSERTPATPKQPQTCGMLLNNSAASTPAAAAASDDPPALPPCASDFDGGASRASAAALAAALDSAIAALTRAWLRLKGEEKSPAAR